MLTDNNNPLQQRKSIPIHNKYYLPRLKTTRQQTIVQDSCSSIFHKQKKKYLIQHVRSQCQINKNQFVKKKLNYSSRINCDKNCVNNDNGIMQKVSLVGRNNQGDKQNYFQNKMIELKKKKSNVKNSLQQSNSKYSNKINLTLPHEIKSLQKSFLSNISALQTNNQSLLKSLLSASKIDLTQTKKLNQQKHTIVLKQLHKHIKRQIKTRNLQRKIRRQGFNLNNLIIKNHQTQDKDTQIYSHYNQTLQRKLIVKSIQIDNKPPHRYKTQIIVYQSSLILFGGIGCDKNLTWSFYQGNSPIYGHTMKSYKNNAYIYGGVNLDTLNDLIILNMNTMGMKYGPAAPFRRKQHAATMVAGKYMVIYGGIQGQQVKNNLFYFDIENCKWVVLPNTNLPYLSHHSMTTMPVKNKRKITHISESNDFIYIFGGKNEKGKLSNSIYKLKIIHDFQISFQQITISQNSEPKPDPRYSSCFQYIQNGNILLYGGKQDQQSYDFHIKNGVFNDSYIFNIYKKTWKKQQTNLDHRHGMASTNNNGRVYIFGGFGDTYYADGNLITMKISQNGNISGNSYAYNIANKNEDDPNEARQTTCYIPSTKRLDYS